MQSTTALNRTPAVNGRLPDMFRVTITDESMAPAVPAGTVVHFSRHVGPLQPRDGVLVADHAGNVFFRRYRRCRDKGHWKAEALSPGYASLDSTRDQLEVLAVMVGRMVEGTSL